MSASERVKRDCKCPRVKHVHGTVEAYTRDGCRCPECSEAQQDKLRWYRKQKAYGRWPEQWVEPVGIMRRLQGLSVLGYSNVEISKYLDCDPEVVRKLMYGQSGGLARASTQKKIADVCRQVLSQPPRSRFIKSIQARAKANGWISLFAWDDDIDDPEALPVEAA